MASYGYHHLPPSQINEMVKRLSRPTRASQTWNRSYEAQQAHVAHLRLEDPYFQQNRTVPPRELDPILQRLQKRTLASTASTYNYDNQEANLMHLYVKDPKMQIGRSPRASASYRSSRSSSGCRDDRDSLLSGRKSRRSDGRPSIGSSGIVSSQEFKSILDRLTKPTVASRGGLAYADRKWEYIPIPQQKTLPRISGLETRYLCKNRTMTQQEFDAMIGRLTRATRASLWKAAPNPH